MNSSDCSALWYGNSNSLSIISGVLSCVVIYSVQLRNVIILNIVYGIVQITIAKVYSYTIKFDVHHDFLRFGRFNS